MSRLVDRTNKRYGDLVVTYLLPSEVWTDTHAEWFCICDCGGAIIVSSKNIDRTKSCGCRRGKSKNALKHGHSRSPNGGKPTRTYRSWSNMKTRCTNPRATGYKYWGGRGITVCERWMTFSNFLEDMGECPEWATGGIDRIDNSGNYEPGNCAWVTSEEQNRNRRSFGST